MKAMRAAFAVHCANTDQLFVGAVPVFGVVAGTAGAGSDEGAGVVVAGAAGAEDGAGVELLSSFFSLQAARPRSETATEAINIFLMSVILFPKYFSKDENKIRLTICSFSNMLKENGKEATLLRQFI